MARHIAKLVDYAPGDTQLAGKLGLGAAGGLA